MSSPGPKKPSTPATNLFLVASCRESHSCRGSFGELPEDLFRPTGAPVFRLGCFAPKSVRFPLIIPLGVAKVSCKRGGSLPCSQRRELRAASKKKGEDFKTSKLPPPSLLPPLPLVQSSPPPPPPPPGFAERRLAGGNGSCPTRQPPEILCFSPSPHHVRAMRPPATPLQWRKICSS